jgi:lipopolysaccharide export system protein LptA
VRGHCATGLGWCSAAACVLAIALGWQGVVTVGAQEQDRRDPAQAKDAPGAKDARKKGFGLPGADKKEPIQIESAILEYDSHENVALFRGDVVTTQGDVVVHSSRLRVLMSDSSSPGSPGRAEHVIAEGNVRILQGERVAVGDRAEFIEADRTVVLTGDAVLHEGSNEVRGERVIVYLDEERSVVEGTNTRVKAILVPKESADEEEGAANPPDEKRAAHKATRRKASR